jgi:hypothetical protein
MGLKINDEGRSNAAHWYKRCKEMEAEHQQALRREEEAGYAKGLRDGRAESIATLRALTDASGVNDDGQAWLCRLTRGDCVAALEGLEA